MNKTTEKSVFYPWHCKQKLFWAFHQFPLQFLLNLEQTSYKCVVPSNQTIEKQFRWLWVQNSLDSENSEPVAPSGRELCGFLFLVLAVRYVSLGTFGYILILAHKFWTHFRTINSARICGLACIITSMTVNLLTSKLWRSLHWKKLF